MVRDGMEGSRSGSTHPRRSFTQQVATPPTDEGVKRQGLRNVTGRPFIDNGGRKLKTEWLSPREETHKANRAECQSDLDIRHRQTVATLVLLCSTLCLVSSQPHLKTH